MSSGSMFSLVFVLAIAVARAENVCDLYGTACDGDPSGSLPLANSGLSGAVTFAWFQGLPDVGLISFMNLAWNPDLVALTPGCFDELSALTYISMDNTGLTFVPNGVFNKLSKLQQMHLQWSKISAWAPGSMLGFRSLSTLNIFNNKFSSLDDTGIETLTNLRRLNMGDNMLVTNNVSGSFFNLTMDMPKLRYLGIHNNFISQVGARFMDKMGIIGWIEMHNSRYTSLPPDIFLKCGRYFKKPISMTQRPGVTMTCVPQLYPQRVPVFGYNTANLPSVKTAMHSS